MLSQEELTPSSHWPGHCSPRFPEWNSRMLSFGSAEGRCIHRNGHLSKDGMARASDSGHLTGRNSRGQGGADVPNLNSRLVDYFTFQHDLLGDLTRAAHTLREGLFRFLLRLKTRSCSRGIASQESRGSTWMASQVSWYLLCRHTHAHPVSRKTLACTLLLPAP